MVRWTSALPFLALIFCVVPDAGLAQPALDMSELARAKSMLDLYRAQLSTEQYALLSSRLAQTEQAYVEREFEAFLREVYRRPDLRARFPHGF